VTVAGAPSGTDLAAAAPAKSKRHKEAIQIGRISKRLAPGALRKLTLTLNAAGRRLLSKDHALTATLTVMSNGTTVKTRTVHLKATPAKATKKKAK
jgi:hypothetical protein